ncbi:hypothetical protein KQH61_05440 [bacterium]|nr:hypothetical protein [bacterium]MCB2179345.1 hypothetical protein [bacterium]
MLGVLTLIAIACNLSGTQKINSLSIVITNPSDNTSTPAGEPLEVTTSSFSDIGITQVKLLVNGQQIAANAPEELAATTFVVTQTWVPTITGTFELSAVVEDIEGQTIQSKGVSITVTDPNDTAVVVPTETTPSTEAPQETPSAPPATAENNQPAATPTSFLQFGITMVAPPIEVLPLDLTPTAFQFAPLPPVEVYPLNSPSVYFQQNILPLAAGQSGQMTVSCNSGDLATSSGYLVSSSWQVRITKSIGNNESWNISASNTSSKDQTATIVVTCLKNSGGTTKIVKVPGVVQPDIEQDITASCPAGTVIAGGGWETNNAGTLIRQSAPSGNGWVIRALHSEASAQQVTAVAVCLSGTNATAEMYMEYEKVGAGKTKEINVFCPSGSLISGGGYFQEFEAYANGPIYTAAEEILYGWQGVGKNPAAQTTFKLYVYANCLRFP